VRFWHIQSTRSICIIKHCFIGQQTLLPASPFGDLSWPQVWLRLFDIVNEISSAFFKTGGVCIDFSEVSTA
jgi:hypothetical protein